MHKATHPFRLAIILLVCAVAPAAMAADLTVFAAASLKTALDEVAKDYEGLSGDTVAISYAGTSTLARQIQRGAPADVIIAANVEWMDVLEDGDHIESGSRRDLLGNQLVLIGAAGEPPLAEPLDGGDLVKRLGDGWLAMALVEAVPAGIYGKQALSAMGIWEQVRHRIAQSDNVRAALALVAAGEATLGIVYATDARAEPRVAIVSDMDPSLHQPIVYPVALVAGGGSSAHSFLNFLSEQAAAAAFESQGFRVIGDGS